MINQKSNYQVTIADLKILQDVQGIMGADGQIVHLRRKEYQLLNFLANNLNTVIDKYLLMDLIWHYESFSGSNTLEVHLSKLRKKISEISNHLAIETIRGVGYRLKTINCLGN